jgi:hypothetical protein
MYGSDESESDSGISAGELCFEVNDSLDAKIHTARTRQTRAKTKRSQIVGRRGRDVQSPARQETWGKSEVAEVLLTDFKMVVLGNIWPIQLAEHYLHTVPKL